MFSNVEGYPWTEYKRGRGVTTRNRVGIRHTFRPPPKYIPELRAGLGVRPCGGPSPSLGSGTRVWLIEVLHGPTYVRIPNSCRLDIQRGRQSLGRPCRRQFVQAYEVSDVSTRLTGRDQQHTCRSIALALRSPRSGRAMKPVDVEYRMRLRWSSPFQSAFSVRVPHSVRILLRSNLLSSTATIRATFVAGVIVLVCVRQ